MPEEGGIHTPVESSEKKEGKAGSPVKNKIFWGAAFVVMIIITFAVLAPGQFSSLLKGSLFEKSGLSGENIASPISPLALLPQGDIEEAEEVIDEGVGEGGLEEIEEAIVGEGEDVSSGTSDEASAETEAPAGAEEDEDRLIIEAEDQPVTISVEPVAEAETIEIEPITEDGEGTLITELQEKIKQMEEDRDDQLEAIEELTKLVQNQMEQDTRAAAPGEVPPGVATTAGIGQTGQARPGFRPNTHTVTVTPEQVLQQNKGLIAKYAQQEFAAVTAPTASYQEIYQQATAIKIQPTAERTPETGPSEMMLIAFIIAFAALTGWKFLKTFA